MRERCRNNNFFWIKLSLHDNLRFNYMFSRHKVLVNTINSWRTSVSVRAALGLILFLYYSVLVCTLVPIAKLNTHFKQCYSYESYNNNGFKWLTSLPAVGGQASRHRVGDQCPGLAASEPPAAEAGYQGDLTPAGVLLQQGNTQYLYNDNLYS